MQICSFRESVTKARGPPAPKLLSKTAGSTAGKIVGAPRRAGPQGHRSVSGEFALLRGVSLGCCVDPLFALYLFAAQPAVYAFPGPNDPLALPRGTFGG